MAEAIGDKKRLDTGCIVSMLYADKSSLLLADKYNIYKYSIPDGTTSLFIKDRTNIPDMTNVDSNNFAFIDQGAWFNSDIYVCKKVSGETVSFFSADVYCSGIAYSENHYFLTFSTAKRITFQKSLVKMVDKHGFVTKIIQVGFDAHNLFSTRISKIFVKSSDVYVADVSKRSLLMIRFNIQGQARVITEWDDALPNSISCIDDKLILALGGNKNEIVLIHDKWSKKIVKQKQLKGEPTAVCVVGKHIFVTTKRGWLFPQFYIQVFEISEARSEDHVVLIFSVWIDHNNVLTLDELIKGFELCYTPRPIGTKTANVYNFHQWLDISSVKNHSKPHVFKITLNENTGKARLLYKNLSTDKEWNVPDGEGDIVTRSGDALMNITPSTEKIDIERLQADLKTVYSFFKAANVKPWWDAYFTELLEEETQDTFETDIITALKNKKAARAHPQEPEDPYIFEDLPDLEQRIPKVLIGKAAKLPKQTESAPRSLTQGDMALSSYDKYPDEFPQLSKVLSVDGDRVSVEWYKGGKTIPWKPATRAVKGGSRGQREPFQEVKNG